MWTGADYISTYFNPFSIFWNSQKLNPEKAFGVFWSFLEFFGVFLEFFVEGHFEFSEVIYIPRTPVVGGTRSEQRQRGVWQG